MRKSAIISVLLAAITTCQLYGQQLISDSLMLHLSQAQVDSAFTINGIPLTSPVGVSFHRLIYSTSNAAHTGTEIVSGLIIVPDSSTCPMAIALYDHGTVTQRWDVPGFLGYESLLPLILATQGYYAIAPDYLGLGINAGVHPYIHAATEAQAGIDMIFASKQFATNHSLRLSDQLFVTGYSQGGHACMATHRAIQQQYAGQLTVTASAPGSGPYNLSGIQAAGLASGSYYAYPSYLPYLVFGYQSVYHNLYDSVPQFLQHPWDSILPPLYTGLISADSINGIMPHYADSFVVDSQLIWYNTDSAHNPLRIDLRDNDVYAWVPQAPMMLVYCTADEQVVYQSSIFAYNYFLSHGDSAVTLINGGALDHENCVVPYLTNVLGFFNGLWVEENALSVVLTADSESTHNASDATVRASVSGGTGYTIRWNTGSSDSIITGVHNGTYTVTVTDQYGCSKVRSIQTGGVPSGIADVSLSHALRLSPNPAADMLTIEVKDLDAETTTVYDANGRKVSEGKYGHQLNVAGFAAGIYTVEVKTVQGVLRGTFIR